MDSKLFSDPTSLQNTRELFAVFYGECYTLTESLNIHRKDSINNGLVTLAWHSNRIEKRSLDKVQGFSHKQK